MFLKGVHFDGSAYSPDEIAALERTTIDAFKPSVVDVRSGDALTARFEADARKLGNCVWPNGRGPEVRYGRASERERMVKRVSHWWGALQAALNGLAAREKARGKVFSKVAACRADADVVAPVRSASSLQTRYVYATSDPPDALWLFGDRASAEAVLGTHARPGGLSTSRGRRGPALGILAPAAPRPVHLFRETSPMLDAGRRRVSERSGRASAE